MPTVLVTGAARGIGRATTLRLAAAGWDVIAGVRRPQDGDSLADSGQGRVRPVALDVSDAEQIAALAPELTAGLDALVGNAGIFVGGPVETVAPDELRRQLEVNVVGQVAVAQAVLPHLRASRGRLVFVSSVAGRISTPMFGVYSASKFALEAVADAMRMELAPWGIRVSVIEPAQTDTDLWRHADEQLDETVAGLSPEHRNLYAKHLEGFRKTIPRSQRAAAPADGVAATIETALAATRPKARYVVGTAVRIQGAVFGALPTPVRDAVLRAASGVPRRP
jgi:NAD(P)-dependent dehydrogenase (short-subunit alcohol dehydrogenase family)